ncbi:hypothetical protein B7H23_03230 [Notoacmeibacter marinus]|uniref:Uncharacterized protein n=1 Tax=Notoacmeibacter marinus TaxID=1876515 RepID=A0A231V1H0_9HYPH|nr:hypothetical protein [Notoacmeibacter marinus]OXT01964.1 hypothetical protein B7H23_03230 [Notoacmeibacter marinus]
MQSIASPFLKQSSPSLTSAWIKADHLKKFEAQRDKRMRNEKQADEADADFFDLAISVVLATMEEIEAFQVKLDEYDEATVQALIANNEQLDAVQNEMNDLLDRAHVMEDGRRVFRTEDRSAIYDENGEKLGHGEIDADAISGASPTWEEYEPVYTERQHLLQERQQLIEFQDKLDEARELSGAEGFTKDELDELDTELEETMPEAVARQLPGYEPETPSAPTAALDGVKAVISVGPDVLGPSGP